MAQLMAIFAGSFLGGLGATVAINWWESRQVEGLLLPFAPLVSIDLIVPTTAEITAGITQ